MWGILVVALLIALAALVKAEPFDDTGLQFIRLQMLMNGKWIVAAVVLFCLWLLRKAGIKNNRGWH